MAKAIKLDFYGLYNGIVALCDRETESVLLQAEGRFINGPLLGENAQSPTTAGYDLGQVEETTSRYTGYVPRSGE